MQALSPPLTPATARAAAQRDLARAFAEAGLETPALDARLLLCGALAVDHVALVRDPEARLGPRAATLRAFVDRRLAREPVSRILGQREFWGLTFTISPAVLDPRPDTELIVETILAGLESRRGDALALLDLGTGSGALLCALLHELPMAFGLGVDRAFDACRVARANLHALGLADRGHIVQGSWAESVSRPFDIVVSNPPYIARAEIGGLDRDVRDHDPPLALDGGADGLDAYRAIVPAVAARLRPGGLAALEIGWTQGERVAALARAAGLADVTVLSDLAGYDRVVAARGA